MSDDMGKAVMKLALALRGGYSSESGSVSGILINREPPITAGWCGNDHCEHLTHKQKRAAQAAADKRKTKQ